MTYKESLEIAFLKTDSESSDYESGLFPVLANEAQMYIAKYGTHIVKKQEYKVDSVPFEADLPKDFYRTSPVGLVNAQDDRTGVDHYIGEDNSQSNKIVINEPGDFVLYYWALPKDITKLSAEELEEYEYEVSEHTHVAIPSYIGYQLVKTDDVQLAQILLNEWNKYLSLFDDKVKAVKRKIRNTMFYRTRRW